MISVRWQKGRQPRRLLCFSAAFFAIALLYSFLIIKNCERVQSLLLLGSAAAGLAAVTVFYVRDEYPVFGALFAGLLAGIIWCGGYGWFILQPTLEYADMTGTVRLEVKEYAQSKESYGLVYGVVTEWEGDPCHIKVRAYLSDGSPEYAPGDVLIFEGKLREADRSARYQLLQNGIYLTLSQKGAEQVLPGAAVDLLCRAKIFSRAMTNAIDQMFSGDEGALLSALLSGENDRFSDTFDQALTTSGTRHVTAVSGLHVTVLAGILMSLLGKKIGLLISVPVAILYSGIVGLSPSVIRATVLLIFWATSFWLKQERDSLTSFAAAMLLLILWNPFSCMDIGLLLSFSATLGLILLSGPINTCFMQGVKMISNRWIKTIVKYVFGTVSATIAATLFTLPLTMLFFDSVPLFSLLTNVLILWILPTTMIVGVMALVLWAVSPFCAIVFARYIAIWPLKWITFVIESIGSMRFAAIGSDNLWLLLTCFILIALLLLWREQHLGNKALLRLAAIPLCLACVFTLCERTIFGVVEIENVGGQPLIILKNEGVSLINSGAQPKAAAELVRSAASRWNVSSIETVLCTTSDYKTQSGLDAVMETVPIQRIYLPSVSAQIPVEWSTLPIYCFSRSGSITVSGCTTELLVAEEDQFALRLRTKDLSILLLCALDIDAVKALTAAADCTADVVLIDDKQANDIGLLYTVYQTVRPEKILLITAGYTEYSDYFIDVPIIAVEREGISYRFRR